MATYEHLDLHPESRAYLKYLSEHTNSNNKTLDEKRTERNKRYAHTTFTDRDFKLTRVEDIIPSPHVKEGIPVYIYTPYKTTDDVTFLVYFHGGGSVLGNRDMVDTVCKIIAEDANCIVVNVEYRLAPEHPSPAQMDDGCTVTQWVKENKAKLGGTSSSKVGVGGDSAGARISASVAHDVQVDFQVLIYPNVSPVRKPATSSVLKYADGPILNDARSKWFADLAIPIGEEKNPRIAPICHKRFDQLPPTLILVAEHDRLYDSGMTYAKVLQDAGVKVKCTVIKGAIHGFFPYVRMYPELGKWARREVIDFLKDQT